MSDLQKIIMVLEMEIQELKKVNSLLEAKILLLEQDSHDLESKLHGQRPRIIAPAIK